MKRAAAQASDAADALLDWLNTQAPRRTPSGRPLISAEAGTPEQHGTDPVALPAALSGPLARNDAVEPAGANPTRTVCPPAAVMRLPNPDWLHHRLTISGPPEAVTAFKRAASGAGIIPWHYDLDRMEEDFFHLLVAPAAPPGSIGQPPRQLSIGGARLFARQLRAAVGHRHAVAVRTVGHSRACLFDLHALVPVPPRSWSSDRTSRKHWRGCGSTGARQKRCAMLRTTAARRPRARRCGKPSRTAGT